VGMLVTGAESYLSYPVAPTLLKDNRGGAMQ
jgi:hypothetical protein